MSESANEPGASSSRVIANRYELGARLGQGAMGTVFRGFDRETRTSVAIKQLRPEALMYDPTGLERFAREGEALRRLNHPNIVKLLATVDEGDSHFLVMELMSGGSLERLLGWLQGFFPSIEC